MDVYSSYSRAGLQSDEDNSSERGANEDGEQEDEQDRTQIRVAMLPIDQEEFDNAIKEREKNASTRDYDEDPDTPCDCCLRVSDDPDLEEYSKIYQLEQDLFRRRPDNIIFGLMSRMYNERFYAKDQKLGRRGIQKWTPEMLKRHFTGETRHDRTNLRRTLWDQINYLDSSLGHLRKNGMWRQKYLEDEPIGPVFLDKETNDSYHKNAKLLLDFSVFYHKLEDEKKRTRSEMHNKLRGLPQITSTRPRRNGNGFPTYG